MAKYVIIYHGSMGGTKPDKEDGAKIMGDWQKWMGDMGANLLDPGCGVGKSKTVMNDGTVVDGGGANPLFGYCIISADNMDEALEKAKKHPFLTFGDNIEIAQAMEHR